MRRLHVEYPDDPMPPHSMRFSLLERATRTGRPHIHEGTAIAEAVLEKNPSTPARLHYCESMPTTIRFTRRWAFARPAPMRTSPRRRRTPAHASHIFSQPACGTKRRSNEEAWKASAKHGSRNRIGRIPRALVAQYAYLHREDLRMPRRVLETMRI